MRQRLRQILFNPEMDWVGPVEKAGPTVLGLVGPRPRQPRPAVVEGRCRLGAPMCRLSGLSEPYQSLDRGYRSHSSAHPSAIAVRRFSGKPHGRILPEVNRMPDVFPLLPALSAPDGHPADRAEDLAALWSAIERVLDGSGPEEHFSLSIQVPMGALHFRNTSALPDREWERGTISLCALPGTVTIPVDLQERTDLSALRCMTIAADDESGEPTTVIEGCKLSLAAFRQVVVRAFSSFAPSSVSVTASE